MIALGVHQLVRCVHFLEEKGDMAFAENFVHVMQVDGCNKDLASEKEYYQRYRICEEHLKLSSLLKDGVQQRFCQQCGRFHLLADFDGDKRCAFCCLRALSSPCHP